MIRAFEQQTACLLSLSRTPFSQLICQITKENNRVYGKKADVCITAHTRWCRRSTWKTEDDRNTERKKEGRRAPITNVRIAHGPEHPNMLWRRMANIIDNARAKI